MSEKIIAVAVTTDVPDVTTAVVAAAAAELPLLRCCQDVLISQIAVAIKCPLSVFARPGLPAIRRAALGNIFPSFLAQKQQDRTG